MGVDLAVIERDSNRRNPSALDGRQLRRYRKYLANLILTKYVEFRRYCDGELVQETRLAAAKRETIRLMGEIDQVGVLFS